LVRRVASRFPDNGARDMEVFAPQTHEPFPSPRPSRSGRPFEDKRILWVDDIPANNVHESARFRSMGATIDAVLDTESALSALTQRIYDLVISDMSRGSNHRAGFDL